jgi:hypothetical protein
MVLGELPYGVGGATMSAIRLTLVGSTMVAVVGLAISDCAEAGVDKQIDYRVKGGFADGSYDLYGTCERFLVSVSAHEDLRSDNENANAAFVTIIQRNYCSNETVLAYGYQISQAFDPPSKQLESAELAESVFPVQRCRFTDDGEVCEDVDAKITVKWEASGLPLRGSYTYYQRFGDGKFDTLVRGRSKGSSREAGVLFSLEIDGVPVSFEGGEAYGNLGYSDSGDYRFVRAEQ